MCLLSGHAMADIGDEDFFALPQVIGAFRYCKGIVVGNEDAVLAVPALAGGEGCTVHRVQCDGAEFPLAFLQVETAKLTTPKKSNVTLVFEEGIFGLTVIQCYPALGQTSGASVATALSVSIGGAASRTVLPTRGDDALALGDSGRAVGTARRTGGLEVPRGRSGAQSAGAGSHRSGMAPDVRRLGLLELSSSEASDED